MDEISCLIFELDQYRYAIETTVVASVVDSPLLGPSAGRPDFVLGEARIGEKRIPVLDLHRLLGHSEGAVRRADQPAAVWMRPEPSGHPFHPKTQSVLGTPELPAIEATNPATHGPGSPRTSFVGWGGAQQIRAVAPLIVIHVNGGEVALAPKKIIGTRPLPVHGSVRMRNPGGEKPQGWKYIARLVSIDLALVMVLDPEAILAALQPGEPSPTRDLPGDVDAVMAAWLADAASPLEGESSADQLAESLFEDFHPASLVAVIRWNGRSYGVPLHQVEEFSEVSRITPLPGCPPHIRGQAALRGDLVTVVDVRPALGLALPECQLPLTAPLLLVLLRQGEERIGIVIDEVRAIVTAREERAREESAIVARSLIAGSIPYGREFLDVLDLQDLLSSEAIVVNYSFCGNLETPRAERASVPPQTTKCFGAPNVAGH